VDLNRSAVCGATARFRAANPRIFGSVLHGTDLEGSDLDLLVDALPGATLSSHSMLPPPCRIAVGRHHFLLSLL